MKKKLTKKQIEIEKFIKDVEHVLNQYEKGKQNYYIKNQYISIDGENMILDNKYLSYLFG